MVAGATSEGICLLEFSDRRMLEAQFTASAAASQSPWSPAKAISCSNSALNSPNISRHPPRLHAALVYPGTEFEQRVWNELLAIPYSETRSYQD